MTDVDLERAVAALPDGADAAARCWPAVRDAYASRDRVRLRARWPVVALAAVLAAAIAVSPPTRAVARWLRDAVTADTPRAQPPRPLAVGGAGRLLLATTRGVWMLRADGSGRLLGYHDATWSPHGLYVAAVRGRSLFAVEPDTGIVHWTLARPAALADPRWAPSGYRIAYRERSTLRLVAGDGTGDRLLAAQTASVPPTWQPGTADAIAYAPTPTTIRVIDADTRRPLAAPLRTLAPIRSIAWTTDGRALMIRSADTLTLVDVRTHRTETLAGGGVIAAAVDPARADRAVILTSSGEIRLVGAGRAARTLLDAPGADDLAYAPDARRLLVSVSARDAWLLVDVRTGAARRIADVAGSLDPDGLGTADFPRLIAWCCGGPAAP